MPYNMQGSCWNCGHQLSERDFARESVCAGCGKPTHVCRNCRFFKPGAPADCSEPVADPVSDKMRANFCGYFEATSQAAAQSTGSGQEEADALRRAADDLFDI